MPAWGVFRHVGQKHSPFFLYPHPVSFGVVFTSEGLAYQVPHNAGAGIILGAFLQGALVLIGFSHSPHHILHLLYSTVQHAASAQLRFFYKATCPRLDRLILCPKRP